MKHISRIIKRVMESIKAEDKTDPDPRCLECGKPGDYYYNGVCRGCASRPFGILWQIEQGQPTGEELKVEWKKLVDEAYEEYEERQRLEAKCWECDKPGDYYHGVCYECAAQPYGLLWQLEQGEP